MIYAVPQFADSTSGIGAFNINLKSFVFQLLTFIIVLMVFKKWILPPIVKTLDDRRTTLEKSLEHAKQTEEALAKAQQQAEDILAKARDQADEALAEAKKAATGVIADAEAAAAQRTSHIIKEAEGHLEQERNKLRQELRKEVAGLVADATTKIIDKKVDAKHDMTLIEKAIKAVTG